MKRRPANVGDLVMVGWVDSTRVAAWTYAPPNLNVAECESVGWLVRSEKECLVVRPHRIVDTEGDVQHFGDMTIPRRCVTWIKVLR